MFGLCRKCAWYTIEETGLPPCEKVSATIWFKDAFDVLPENDISSFVTNGYERKNTLHSEMLLHTILRQRTLQCCSKFWKYCQFLRHSLDRRNLCTLGNRDGQNIWEGLAENVSKSNQSRYFSEAKLKFKNLEALRCVLLESNASKKFCRINPLETKLPRAHLQVQQRHNYALLRKYDEFREQRALSLFTMTTSRKPNSSVWMRTMYS